MIDADYARKLDEIDRLLNDPAVPLDAAMVWSLLSEIARYPAEPAQGVANQPARKSSIRAAA